MEERRETAPASFLKTWSDRVNTCCEMLLFVTLIAMTVVTMLQIVFRLWFRALTWSEELTCFLLVAASFLGTAVAFKRGAHIAVGFLLNLLPKPLMKLCMIGIACVGTAFFAVVAWYGAVLCWQERAQTATAITISMGWIYLIFPLTGLIVILHLAARIEELLRGGE
ncbi:MAG: TRAP transporter small permease [Synergistaceae bacterium]|jgi:TRAP-type C4-dicarboxylate transport system permease small subunit|nr:TRAP transporter small permease [Synergistaceae bacterium]